MSAAARADAARPRRESSAPAPAARDGGREFQLREARALNSKFLIFRAYNKMRIARFAVPEGPMKIARRFNAGSNREGQKSRKGRLSLSFVPSRPGFVRRIKPGVETPGYSQSFLRNG